MFFFVELELESIYNIAIVLLPGVFYLPIRLLSSHPPSVSVEPSTSVSASTDCALRRKRST